MNFLPADAGLGFASCENVFLCPLSRVRKGSAVRIKQRCGSPEVIQRLREIGFCEEQTIRLLAGQTNIICQVCNARLAISVALAETILVETLTSRPRGCTGLPFSRRDDCA